MQQQALLDHRLLPSYTWKCMQKKWHVKVMLKGLAGTYIFICHMWKGPPNDADLKKLLQLHIQYHQPKGEKWQWCFNTTPMHTLIFCTSSWRFHHSWAWDTFMFHLSLSLLLTNIQSKPCIVSPHVNYCQLDTYSAIQFKLPAVRFQLTELRHTWSVLVSKADKVLSEWPINNKLTITLAFNKIHKKLNITL